MIEYIIFDEFVKVKPPRDREDCNVVGSPEGKNVFYDMYKKETEEKDAKD